MNTRVLMGGSAVIMALLGVAASFGPEELLTAAGVGAPEGLKLLVQVMGALYLGFAVLNWMSKDSVIGGIYARPTTMANFLHFFSGGMAILKVASREPGQAAFWALAIVYGVFAVGFGLVAFRPAKLEDQEK